MSGNNPPPVVWKPKPAPAVAYVETEIIEQPVSRIMREALDAYRHAQPRSEPPRLMPDMKV